MVRDVLKQLRSNGSPYAACVVFGLVGALNAQQTSERLIRVNDVEHITDAVLISNVAVAGKTVECGLFIKPPVVIQPVTPFQAGSDWLDQMTISLINRTGRTIVSGAVQLNFLDVGDCRSLPCAASFLRFGRMPDVDAFDGRTGKPNKPAHEGPPLDWKPEQTIVLHVSDYMSEIGDDLANHWPVTAITKVDVRRGVFYFDDGMIWDLGRYAVPHPEHPGKFKTLPDDYFPGQRGHNWPPGYNN
jgi:hypothetical protein